MHIVHICICFTEQLNNNKYDVNGGYCICHAMFFDFCSNSCFPLECEEWKWCCSHVGKPWASWWSEQISAECGKSFLTVGFPQWYGFTQSQVTATRCSFLRVMAWFGLEGNINIIRFQPCAVGRDISHSTRLLTAWPCTSREGASLLLVFARLCWLFLRVLKLLPSLRQPGSESLTKLLQARFWAQFCE